MNITRELVIVLFSLFPFLETTCTKVADQTQSEAEIVQDILDDPYTPNNIQPPVWTADPPTEPEPDEPEEDEYERGKRERYERAKEIEQGNGGSPWINGPRLERSPHWDIGLPDVPQYQSGPMAIPLPFGPGGVLAPTPVVVPPIPGVPGSGYNLISIDPETYETMYWENMYDPYTDSRGIQFLELDDYGYPVRIPGTDVSIPTPDQYSMLYWWWQYNGSNDARWNHPTVTYTN